MELLAFFLAIGALIWVYKNHGDVRELKEEQSWLQKELAQLKQELTKSNVATPEAAAAPLLAPREEPVRERRPVSVTPPRMETPQPVQQPTEPKPSMPPRPPVRPAVAPLVPKPAFDWEAVVGVQLFSWIAGIALVLAAVFFLKYSIDHGWLGPPIRMAIGLVFGNAILVLCEWRVARRYAVTANALDGAGIAILFATFFAAHSLWNLIGVFPAFAMMALVTAVAVLLSLHHDSLFVALLGLVGGFATPALLSTGEDRPIGLFSYLLLLNAGLAWVAYRKRWPHLTVLSAVFTTLYQWGWVMKFMHTGSVPLALGVFLIFPALSLTALAFGEKENSADARSPWFQQTAALTVALPMFFAMYLASVPGFGNRYWLLFGFLLLLDVGLATIAVKRGPEALHLAGAIGTLATVLAWLQVSYQRQAWPVVLGIVVVFAGFYLAAGYWIRFRNVGTHGVLAAPLLLVAFPILANIEPAAASPGLLFGGLFALASGIALYAIVRRHPAIHHVGAVFVLATETVWSVKYLDAGRLYPALFVYALVALFYLLVPILQSGFGQGTYLALSGHAFLFLVVFQDSLAVPPWPFLLVLGVLDLAIAVAALRTRRGEVHLGALAASQILLVCWETTVQRSPWPILPIVCAVVVAAVGVAWFWLDRRISGANASPARSVSAVARNIKKGRSHQDAARTETPSAGASLASAGAIASLLGMLVVWAAVFMPASPGVTALTASLTALVCFILVVDRIAEWHFLAPFAVIPSACIVFSWSAQHFSAEKWSEEFLFAGLVHVVFLGYPLLIGSSAGKSTGPYLAAVLSSVTFFLFARHSLMAGGFERIIGILPVAQAAVMSVLLWNLLKLEPAGDRTLGRLALVAGSVLAFITVAIPLQLEKQWITIGWALQAAALAWLSRKIPHKGLVIWTGGLMAAVLARLVLNPAVLTYHPRSAIPVLNWYLYTYLVAAAAFFMAAWFLRGTDRFLEDLPSITTLAAAAGTLLLFLVLNIEIADYYSIGPNLTFNFSAGLAQDLTYTIGWGLFAFAMLIAGISLLNKAARVAAILLLSVTVGKCFLHDLWQLGGLYRVGSFVGLAVCLTLVAVLLQRFVLRVEEREGHLGSS